MSTREYNPSPARPKPVSEGSNQDPSQPNGYDDVRGGEAAKPGQSPHDAKRTENGRSERN
jgi:hypothetical protein